MVKTIIICDKCGSQEIEYIETRKSNVETAKVLNCDSLNTYFVDRSYDEVRVYKCQKCGQNFEENLGTRTYHLSPWEIFK